MQRVTLTGGEAFTRPDFFELVDGVPELGGALFLFVRGMVGPERACSSVFFDRQSAEFLDAIDAWLGGRDESR